MGKDGLIIKAAIEEGSTRTGALNRGKGLHQMVEFIKTVDGGYLSIYSNRGVYSITDRIESHRTYSESIFGTLIQWSIPLSEKVD